MTFAKDLSLAYGVYLHGRDISVGVGAWTDHSQKLADDRRTVSNKNRRSYPYRFANQPNAPDMAAFELSYQGIQSKEDLAHLRYVRAVGGLLDVCDYTLVTEVWKSDTAFSTVVTQRRLALRTITVLPAGAETDLAETALADGSAITEGAGAGHYVVGSPDADGRVTITLGTAANEFAFDYVPLYYMVDAAISRVPGDKLSVDWILSLVEAV